MTAIILPRNHQLYLAADAVRQLCRPLKRRFNIEHFSYVKVNPDLSRIHLDTSPEWIEHFYQHAYRYYQSGGLAEGKHWQSSFTFLRLLQNEDECIHDAKDYNIIDGIVIADHQQGYTELSFFAFGRDYTRDDYHLMRLVNNLDYLMKFIEYFKQKAVTHIEASETIHLPFLTPQQAIEPLYDESLYVDEDDDVLLYHHEQRPALTMKELSCCRLLLQGLSTIEIADELFISVRTVEKHLANARQKTGVRHTIQLIRWLHNNVKYYLS